MHSIAIVAETRGITVDADALRAEVGAVEEEEDALLMLVEEEEEAPRAVAAAPSAAEQLEKLEAELARLQQLCDAKEGELTTYKMTEAASSTRLEGACKMMEQASVKMQALENDKARLEGELCASEEYRKTFETTVMAEHTAELRALGETLAQAQLSAEKLKMDLRDALDAAVEAEKKKGLAQVYVCVCVCVCLLHTHARARARTHNIHVYVNIPTYIHMRRSVQIRRGQFGTQCCWR
jgi:hypothetical protein